MERCENFAFLRDMGDVINRRGFCQFEKITIKHDKDNREYDLFDEDGERLLMDSIGEVDFDKMIKVFSVLGIEYEIVK